MTMTLARRGAPIVVTSLAAVLTACGAAAGSGASRPSVSRSHTYPVALSAPATDVSRRLPNAIALARAVYANEINGGRVHADMRLLASDAALLEALARGDLVAAHAEAWRVMTSNRQQHITRVGVVRGGHVLVNAVWNGNGTFVAAPLARAIALHGRSLGTLLVSVQDIIGYVKLTHKLTGDEIVVRGSSGQVRASLPAAARAALPGSGEVKIGATRYRVGSFHVAGWADEPLTVWVLQPA
jgi:hypothetical protein